MRLEKQLSEDSDKAEKRKTADDENFRFQERDLHKLELKILVDRQMKIKRIKKTVKIIRKARKQ